MNVTSTRQDGAVLYLGVDGGGTKTTAVLTDKQGQVFRTLKTGACNVAVLKPDAIREIIQSILAMLPGGTSPSAIANAIFAFAGAGRPKEREITRQIIRSLGVDKFSIMTDAEILYVAAFGEERGILLSAGTGSICLIRNSDGMFKQIGGRGYLLGDEGSGFDIGNRAIRQAIRDAEDAHPTSDLTRKLLEFYELNQPEELVSIVYTSNNPPNVVASCARLVCDLAEAGEPNARTIVDGAAAALVNLALHARDNLPITKRYVIALAGSILQEGSVVNKRFKALLQQSGMNADFISEFITPAGAALRCAIAEDGGAIDPQLEARLKNIEFA